MDVALKSNPLYSGNDQSERLYDTGVSAGFSIGYVASEILIDAVKILIGKPELVRYGGRVEVVDHFASMQKTTLRQNDRKGRKVTRKQLLLLSLLSFVLTGLSAVWGTAAPTIPICYFMLCTLIAAVWYGEPQAIFLFAMMICLHSMLFILVVGLESLLLKRIRSNESGAVT